jgi:hypothetical protein
LSFLPYYDKIYKRGEALHPVRIQALVAQGAARQAAEGARVGEKPAATQ